VEAKVVVPTVRGQVTIPKEIRDKLKIGPRTKLKVFLNGSQVVFEPVSTVDELFRELRAEAVQQGFTREELDQEIQTVRERLFKEIYGEPDK